MVYEQAQGLSNFMKIKSYPTMLVYNISNGKLVSFNGVEDMRKFREQTFKLWGSV
jgi:hypothetical protein